MSEAPTVITGAPGFNDANRWRARKRGLPAKPWPARPPRSSPMPCDACGNETWFGPDERDKRVTCLRDGIPYLLLCTICARGPGR